MDNQLPHLNVINFEESSYKANSVGGRVSQRPQVDRAVHSAQLSRQLERAWEQAESRQVVCQVERNGIYLEFKGQQGHELVTKSLESIRGTNPENWTRLLNVRTEKVQTEGGDQEVTFATVHVPHSKKDAFFQKIEQYASVDNDSDRGKPKNAALLESISEIREALEIESFWLDNKDLIPRDMPQWCEIWLSSDKDEVIARFETLLEQLQVNSNVGVIKFPERAVKIVCVSREQLQTITRFSDDIAEYRRAKETAAFWLDQTNREQAEWTETITDRLAVPESSRVAVCILDTGVNNGHPLITPVLRHQHCQTVDPDWGSHDHDGHGTMMAGVSIYGDLQQILEHDELVELRHYLESVKILPAGGDNKPELWGYVTSQGVARAEIESPETQRVICMAVTSEDSRDCGRPSSWSAEVDQVCSGIDNAQKRLFIVSAGNITSWDQAHNYPHAQLTDSIHDPAQSWNALTVGAYTELDVLKDPTYSGYQPIAPAGGLSPFSTTSTTWEKKWPIKPEILMEGGNSIPGIDGVTIDYCCDDLAVLSTHYKPHLKHFTPFNMTSAATAKAAWFAAQLQAEYPDYWPETIRGLMVHSAQWTDTLKSQFLENQSKGSYEHLLKVCGYGVPSLERARFSANNSLTLISQAELQPFDRKESGSGYRTKDMHLYELPWPKEVLLSLPDDVQVEMRITLSYFIEPGPGEIGWRDRYRYASHGLRFDLNSPRESKTDFERRINKAARGEEGGHPGTNSAAGHWLLGRVRDRGSIHSDIWKGTAADLATSNIVGIYPVIGWWRERSHLGKWGSKTRYSLIVSITTSEDTVDVYTPVAVELGIQVPTIVLAN